MPQSAPLTGSGGEPQPEALERPRGSVAPGEQGLAVWQQSPAMGAEAKRQGMAVHRQGGNRQAGLARLCPAASGVDSSP